MKSKILIVVFFLSFSAIFSNKVFAADITDQLPMEWFDAKNCNKENKEICGEAYVKWAQNASIYSVSNSTIGYPGLLTDSSSFKNSALGMIGGFIGQMYSYPPASTSYFAYDLLHNAGFIPKAYAQGIGFPGLSPILPLWKAFRNISYLIMLVILIVVGFMIMFRMKINPQTVISIQNALPNLVITLLLITFSYAIAGFMIDLMYFAMMIIISVVAGSGFGQLVNSTNDVTVLQQFFINANVGDLFKAVVSEKTIFTLPAAVFGSSWGGWIDAFEGATTATELFNNIIFGTLGSVLATVGSAIGILLIALALLFSFVRIFFILLNSYIQIILAIIFAPFQLLIGAIPGQSSFRNWILGLIGNLSVFPTAVFIFLLGGGISHLGRTNWAGDPDGSIWIAPFIAGQTSDAAIITSLIGFGLIILTPSLLNAVKGAFQAKPVLPITPGMLFSPIQGIGATSLQALSTQHYISQALQKDTIVGRLLSKTPLAGLVK